MNMIVKYMIYFIIIAGGIDRALNKPVHMTDVEIHEAEYRQQLLLDGVPRPQRQVVQPTWLTGGDSLSPAVDPNVHVTKESLKEAAIIRGEIQTAVNKGQMIGEMSPQTDGTSPPLQPSFFNAPDPLSFDQPPPWSFQFPQFQPGANTPNFAPFMPQQPNNLMEDWQRRWLEFMENSRRMFSWN